MERRGEMADRERDVEREGHECPEVGSADSYFSPVCCFHVSANNVVLLKLAHTFV